MGDVVLEMRDICKSFPGVRANKSVNLTLHRGEVLALLGENGAGKTTLMNILYGYYQPDSGDIILNGKKQEFPTPRAAIRAGIGMVHQHFMLVPVFSALENIVLGLDLDKGVRLEHSYYSRKISETAAQYGLSVQLDKKIRDLSVGEQQRIEILKALYREADILILDEPTSVLTPQESEDLFRMLRKFRDAGKSIIFISHKMEEIMNFSDRITVLRQGENAGGFIRKEVCVQELAECMVGHDVQCVKNVDDQKNNNVLVRIEDIHVGGKRNAELIKGVNLEIREGEILGLAGIDGNGQTELAEALLGLRTITQGRILFQGKDITNASTEDLLDLGIGHIPADRKVQGLVLEYSIEENLVLHKIAHPSYSRKGIVKSHAIAENAENLIEEFDIRPPFRKNKVQTLSGGNQQKTVVAREFSHNPVFLVAVNPIRGIDLKATMFIHKKLIEKKHEGACILLISTDLEEILDISDRVAVIHHGEITGILDTGAASAAEIGLLMTGVRKPQGENA